MEETNNSGCSGCLGFIIMVLIVAYIFNSCVFKDDNKNVVDLNISAAASLKEVMVDLETEYKNINECI